MPTDTALHKAAHNGDIIQVKKLLDQGESQVDAPGAADRRPLHRAAGGNHVEVCECLLSHGATLDQRDKSGRTPLHWACMSGHTKSTQFLVESGADVLAASASSNMPLHVCAENGQAALATVLTQEAGDRKLDMFNAKNEDEKTPVDLAREGKHKAVLKVLKESGDPNVATSAVCIIL